MDVLERRIIQILMIPQYMSSFANNDSLLNGKTSTQCFLPNHQEQKGQSFSYNPNTHKWSCYGKCSVYGKNVVDLHMYVRKLPTREEALEHLVTLLKLDTKVVYDSTAGKVDVNQESVNYRALYAKSCKLAQQSTELALELDYIMSFYKPTDKLTNDLEGYVMRNEELLYNI